MMTKAEIEALLARARELDLAPSRVGIVWMHLVWDQSIPNEAKLAVLQERLEQIALLTREQREVFHLLMKEGWAGSWEEHLAAAELLGPSVPPSAEEEEPATTRREAPTLA